METDKLDALGRLLLEYAEYRTVCLVTLAVVLLFFVVRRARYGARPSIREALGVTASVLAIFSALTVATVFLLTSPPAVDALSRERLGFIGLVTLIAVVGQAGSALLSLFVPEPEAGKKAGADVASGDSGNRTEGKS